MKRIVKVFQNKLAVICFHVVFRIPRLLNNKVKLHCNTMSLILLNLQSNQQIKLDNDTPLIIGRGNIEGCFDKRISRNHGRITCTVDGKVRVAALHCNPCFFRRNGVSLVHQLNKDEEETLNEGDHLGLLPNAFWFKVTSNTNTENKTKPEFSAEKTDVNSDEINQTIVLENRNTSSSHVEEIIIEEEPECELNNKSMKDKSNLLASTSNSQGLAKFGSPEFEKTKRLPLWMYEIDDPVPGNSPKKHSLEEANNSKQKKQKILPVYNIKKEFKVKSPKKIKEEVNDFDIPSTSRVDEISTLPCKSENQEETSKESKKKEEYEILVEDEKDLVFKRPICLYEDKCYRKNPQHKLDFSHPGDPDYIPHEERPVCQYGAACYRQNEKHKAEFKHPPRDSNHTSPSPSLSPRASSPLPEKRTRKTINMQNYDYEDDDDEYDLEEPFANDASSDDFIPSDLESEEEELLDASLEDDK